MSYDPNQPPGGYPPPPGYGYQPPEGTSPGTYPPPPPGGGYPGGYVPPPGGAPPPGAPPYGGQPQYYSGYPGPMAPSTSGWAIASLVLSIVSWLGVVGLGAILGVIFGHLALNEIKQSQGRVEGRGMAIAGLIIGYAHLVALVCVVAFFIFAAIIGASTQTH